MSTQKDDKHKRSNRETAQLARQRLSALQEELSGIEEIETKKEVIRKHVDALQDILGNTKKLVNPFCVSCLTYSQSLLARNFRFLPYNDPISQTWD